MNFFHLVASGVKTVDIMSFLVEKRCRGIKGALQCYRILPSYHIYGDNSDCLRKNAILSQFDLWWPLASSVLT